MLRPFSLLRHSPYLTTSFPHIQENNSVTELREKIKTFLASQGMIKGHSGSGPRSNEGEPQVLILVDNLHSSNPSSPPTPTLSAGSNGEHRQQGPMTSYVRDGSHYQPTLPPPEQQQYHPPPPPPSMYSFMINSYPLGSNSFQAGSLMYRN